MTRTWTIIGVRDVGRSFAWYQSLFGQPASAPAHDHFGQLLDADGTVLLCLHQWSAHGHPSLLSPDVATPGNGLLLFFRVDHFDASLANARTLVPQFEEEPHVNPNTTTREFSLRDLDGYYVTISDLGRRDAQGRSDRPIGYWLKHADAAITEHVAGALGQLELTRLHWQALNVIRASQPCTADHLANELRGFVDANGLESLISALVARGWVAEETEPHRARTVVLTPSGSAGYAEALHLQTLVRERMMRNIPAQDYETVLRVLQTIVANMGADDPAPR